MDIFTKSPGERYEEVSRSGGSFAAAGEIEGYALLRADLPEDAVEYFMMDGERPVAAALLCPWDDPEGYKVEHASVEPSHRGQGLIRQLYLHLLEGGTTLLSDNERSPDAERLWRWLASSGHVSLSLLPAVPEDGQEGEMPVEGTMSLDRIGDRSEWHYVARSVGPRPEVSEFRGR